VAGMTDARVRLPFVDVLCLTACPLRCAGCTNGMGMPGLKLEVFPLADVAADITAAARVMHAEIACLLGGEPLVHPRIVDLIRHAKASGLCDRVRVLTNGMPLHRMGDDFWAEIDDLKVSIYPGRTPPENVALAKRRQAEHGFDLSFYDVASDPFRAVLTRDVRTPESAQETYQGCWYKTFTRKIEQGHFYRCCTSPSISKTLMGLPPDHDGIALDGLTTETLQEFLDRPTFMESCTRCHGNLGPRLGAWSEERNRDAWLERSMVNG
jgi:cyclic pyranopterin phosphate synthase